MKAIKYIAALMMVTVTVMVWNTNLVAALIALSAALVTLIPGKK